MLDPYRISLLEQRIAFLEHRIATLEQLSLSPQVPQPSLLPPPHPGHLPPARPSRSPATPEPAWRPVYHRDPPGCGQLAFYLTRLYGRTEIGRLEDMRVGRGFEIPKPGDAALCLSCDAPMDPLTSAELDWSQALAADPAIPATITAAAADPTGRLASVQDAISRARAAGISL